MTPAIFSIFFNELLRYFEKHLQPGKSFLEFDYAKMCIGTKHLYELPFVPMLNVTGRISEIL